jgi:O-antigen/teichoic acid export membrane protein
VLGGLVFHVILASDGLRRYPRVLGLVRDRAPRAELQREMWSLNTSTFIVFTCIRISLLSDQIIVAGLLGPAMVVPLYLTQRLAELATAQVQAIGSSSWAALTELYVLGDRETFNRRILDLSSLVATLGVAALAPIVAYNRHFIALWVGPQHYAGELATVVAASNAFLLSTVTLWDFCLSGTGHIRCLVPLSLVSAAINLTASLGLTGPLGVAGPLLGTLIALLSTSLWYQPRLLRRVFGTPLGGLFRAWFRPLAWGIPYTGALWWLARARSPQGLPGLAAEMAAAAALYLVVVVGLDPVQRALYLERAQILLRRRPVTMQPAADRGASAPAVGRVSRRGL